MRSIANYSVGLILLTSCFSCQNKDSNTKNTRRPKVVFILTDDQRSDAFSVNGNPHLKTPNIDRLANEGVNFKNYFCTTSLCSISRASILSGKYAHVHGVVNNFTEYLATYLVLRIKLRKAISLHVQRLRHSYG